MLPALYLLGLLTNYNKFEFQNPYRLRLDDFVNDTIIKDMITCLGTSVALSIADVAMQTRPILFLVGAQGPSQTYVPPRISHYTHVRKTNW